MLKKHESATSKVAVTIETIQDILDNSDDCVLVFSEFVDVCKAIHAHFADKAIYHDGQMSDDARDRAKEAFQNPDTTQRILVSTRQSLAVGATLTRANQVVFNDLPWNSADIEQASDRTHRIGQHKPVTCHWVVADNSPFDVRIVELIEKKHKICKAVTEGRQISAEEAEFLKRPISMCDIVGKD
jgi:SNF2 family DNA or RNA helicase